MPVLLHSSSASLDDHFLLVSKFACDCLVITCQSVNTEVGILVDAVSEGVLSRCLCVKGQVILRRYCVRHVNMWWVREMAQDFFFFF